MIIFEGLSEFTITYLSSKQVQKSTSFEFFFLGAKTGRVLKVKTYQRQFSVASSNPIFFQILSLLWII